MEEEAGEQQRRSKPGRVMRVVHGDEEGRRVVEKVAVPETRRPDTIRYVERKLWEKGLHRMERHPVHGGYGPHKSGHGGKYTWEGPADRAHAELDPAPAAIDEADPNYERPGVEVGGAAAAGEEEEEEQGGGLVVGEVEVAEAREGVSRIEVLPPLRP
ncbi:hypothetical protein Taro_045809 [Colocasia esculenta]|uniref:Uncharacterized protein n=1 Tax=Colocasia esculenta TaxID=4460 RepID=A0A843WXW9_COLES|nr:hypothetical protein [Colocasia esculenta]